MFDTLNAEELEFVRAIEKFKARTGKNFPSWTEVLQVLKDLGYRKMPARSSARQLAEESLAPTSETASSN